MFTYSRDVNYIDKIHCVCLSTDTKLTNSNTANLNCGNGSDLLEIDTGDVYVYDKANEQWRKL